DGARTGVFVPRAGRTAHEDLAAALSVARALGIERTLNRDLPDVRIEQKSWNFTGRVHGSQKRLVQLGARYVVGRDERHPHRVQARLEGDARSRATVASRVFDFPIPIE